MENHCRESARSSKVSLVLKKSVISIKITSGRSDKVILSATIIYFIDLMNKVKICTIWQKSKKTWKLQQNNWLSLRATCIAFRIIFISFNINLNFGKHKCLVLGDSLQKKKEKSPKSFLSFFLFFLLLEAIFESNSQRSRHFWEKKICGR